MYFLLIHKPETFSLVILTLSSHLCSYHFIKEGQFFPQKTDVCVCVCVCKANMSQGLSVYSHINQSIGAGKTPFLGQFGREMGTSIQQGVQGTLSEEILFCSEKTREQPLWQLSIQTKK